MKAKLLNREQILTAQDIKTVDVDVPAWGGTVRLAEITAADRNNLQSMTLDSDNKPRPLREISDIMTFNLVAMCLMDEDGKRPFMIDDGKGGLMPDADGVKALGRKNAVALNKVYQAADRLNGITGAAGDEIRKN